MPQLLSIIKKNHVKCWLKASKWSQAFAEGNSNHTYGRQRDLEELANANRAAVWMSLWFFPFDKAAPNVLLAGHTGGIAFKNKFTAILALLDFCEWALKKNQGLLFYETRHSRQVISHFWDCQWERRVIWGMEMNHRVRFLPPTTSYCALCIKKKNSLWPQW